MSKGGEYLPFNGGPQICLGKQYALTEVKYVISRLFQEFKEIEWRDKSVYGCQYPYHQKSGG
jgi:cytochrome P450